MIKSVSKYSTETKLFIQLSHPANFYVGQQDRCLPTTHRTAVAGPQCTLGPQPYREAAGPGKKVVATVEELWAGTMFNLYHLFF